MCCFFGGFFLDYLLQTLGSTTVNHSCVILQVFNKTQIKLYFKLWPVKLISGVQKVIFVKFQLLPFPSDSSCKQTQLNSIKQKTQASSFAYLLSCLSTWLWSSQIFLPFYAFLDHVYTSVSTGFILINGLDIPSLSLLFWNWIIVLVN